MVPPHRLWPHPDRPPNAELVVKAGIAVTATNHLLLSYRVYGGIDRVLWPDTSLEGRTDRLWKHSCFEAFLADGTGRYTELNFAPGRQWAAYAFDNYRAGMRDDGSTKMHRLDWVWRDYLSIPRAELHARVALPGHLVAGSAIGLSAVIEEIDGTKSYWALAHAPGPPDFHNRDCFIATLPAPTGA